MALRCIMADSIFYLFLYSGVAHSDDIQYFFETTTMANIAPGSPDEAFSKKVVKLWVSFAYTGYDLLYLPEFHTLCILVT